ncbi:MAG: FAD-dependent oxidoreductase [Clostridiales Family XIII bacterium]|jgi:NADPH-dependent 2,4-dienoyl-CoA reductase/sulfur reductase-like enzyme|nr:FAD-dependent oxidoreductase [Clostridiales Family XIII bacterium]
MKTEHVDIAIIGGGPAGLAAAIEAKRQGVEKVCIIERDTDLGGILQQCIHDGFGLKRFGKQMSGGQYAEAFIEELAHTDVDVRLKTMVTKITEDRRIFAVNEREGMICLNCGAIILAMGCRERSRNQIQMPGARPSGVMTAGAVQRYINMEGYLPGKKAVILGSGDIGLIMARRMTLEGIAVEGVYEVMSGPGGLTRNIVQCLGEFDIPLHLSTTVTRVFGKERITGVEVSAVDADRRPIAGTERRIDCDLLVLAVGLIPENELSKGAGVELDARTNGPVVDQDFMTSAPGIFAAGNVVAVFDLVDYVSDTGEMAARGAAAYLRRADSAEIADARGGDEASIIRTIAGTDINFIVPQKLNAGKRESDINLFLRVKKTGENQKIRMVCKGASVSECREAFVAPPEMLVAKLAGSADLDDDLRLNLEANQ